MLHRLAAAALALVLATPAFADTLVVTAARMVDVERGRYVDNPVVVVTDGDKPKVKAKAKSKPEPLPLKDGDPTGDWPTLFVKDNDNDDDDNAFKSLKKGLGRCNRMLSKLTAVGKTLPKDSVTLALRERIKNLIGAMEKTRKKMLSLERKKDCNAAKAIKEVVNTFDQQEKDANASVKHCKGFKQ